MSTTELLEWPPATSNPIPRQRTATTTFTRRRTERDRFIDVLRIGAILVVVAEHWLMPVLGYENGRLTTGNALSTPGAWVVTWFGQVMPLIFFAGGAAAAMSFRKRPQMGKARPSKQWVADRLVRLAWPVLALAVVWLPLPYVLEAAGVPSQPLDMGTRIIGQLLWFLAVYVVITALTPLLVRWHDKWRGLEIVALAGVAVLVDVVRFGPLDNANIGYANIVFVWAAIHQVGIAYASGRLTTVRGITAATIGAGGFAVTGLAVAHGPYPLSMIGMPGAPLSNMNPPTAVLIGLAVFQLGFALAIKPYIQRWASAREVSRALDQLSKRTMTIYLWHMPALVIAAGVAVVGIGYETPSPFGEQWRQNLPMWMMSLALVLAVLVGVFGRFEHPPSRPFVPRPRTTATAAALVGAGLLALTTHGFSANTQIPLVAGLSLAVGIALLQSHQLPGSLLTPITRKA